MTATITFWCSCVAFPCRMIRSPSSGSYSSCQSSVSRFSCEWDRITASSFTLVSFTSTVRGVMFTISCLPLLSWVLRKFSSVVKYPVLVHSGLPRPLSPFWQYDIATKYADRGFEKSIVLIISYLQVIEMIVEFTSRIWRWRKICEVARWWWAPNRILGGVNHSLINNGELRKETHKCNNRCSLIFEHEYAHAYAYPYTHIQGSANESCENKQLGRSQGISLESFIFSVFRRQVWPSEEIPVGPLTRALRFLQSIPVREGTRTDVRNRCHTIWHVVDLNEASLSNADLFQQQRPRSHCSEVINLQL